MKTRFVVLVVVLAGFTEVLAGQQSDPRIPNGKALGFTVDRFRFLGPEDDRFTAFTFHVTDLKRNRLSPDLALGTFPQMLAGFHLPVVFDAAVAYNITLPWVTILPRAGPSAFFLAGRYVNGNAIGFHAGVSVLINFTKRDAIRFDLTRREYFRGFSGEKTGTLSIGIGVSGIPSRAGTKP